MMATYAVLWNFIIGGVTGIYLSDVPADYDLHGSMFVTAHFHYTLMGAGLTGAIGALAYWFPKMTGRVLNRGAGFASFWMVQIGFNVTFLGMFAVGPVRAAPAGRALRPHLRVANPVSSIGAYVIGLGMLCCSTPWSVSWRTGRWRRPTPGAQDARVDRAQPDPAGELRCLPVVIADRTGSVRATCRLVPPPPSCSPRTHPAGVGAGAGAGWATAPIRS